MVRPTTSPTPRSGAVSAGSTSTMPGSSVRRDHDRESRPLLRHGQERLGGFSLSSEPQAAPGGRAPEGVCHRRRTAGGGRGGRGRPHLSLSVPGFFLTPDDFEALGRLRRQPSRTRDAPGRHRTTTSRAISRDPERFVSGRGVLIDPLRNPTATRQRTPGPSCISTRRSTPTLPGCWSNGSSRRGRSPCWPTASARGRLGSRGRRPSARCSTSSTIVATPSR